MDLRSREAELQRFSNLLDKHVSEFEDDILSKLLELEDEEAYSNFYYYLDRRTKKFEKKTKTIFDKMLKYVSVLSGVKALKDSSKIFRRSSSFFLKRALGSYKSNIKEKVSYKRLLLQEDLLRKELGEKVEKQRKLISENFKDEFSMIVTAGKRNFQLGNYLNMVSKNLIYKFNNNSAFEEALATGAIGIKISNHNTITPMCKEFEGKIYYFDKEPNVKRLRLGLPPFHPNCLHFILPVYEEDL